VIIFSSIRFLRIKTTKPKFCKIQKLKLKPVQTDQFRFSYFILKTKTQPIGFGYFRFGFGAVRFGYFILKTKNYIVFLGFFFGLFNELGFDLVWFFYFFGSVFRCQANEFSMLTPVDLSLYFSYFLIDFLNFITRLSWSHDPICEFSRLTLVELSFVFFSFQFHPSMLG
jgi:hypothetical protein